MYAYICYIIARNRFLKEYKILGQYEKMQLRANTKYNLHMQLEEKMMKSYKNTFIYNYVVYT